MDRYSVSTPEGTRDRLSAECEGRRRAESAITAVFRKNGYSEIITPEVEYYDLFVRSGNPMPQEAMMKIVDRSGRILVMRPDNTTPIARVAAGRLRGGEERLKLFYDQTVFRSGDMHNGSENEIPQCGVEYIGVGGIEADAEVIVTGIQALEAAGAGDFHMELGHAGYFKALVSSLAAGDEAVERIRKYIERKNFAALSDFLEPYKRFSAAGALSRLGRLFGDSDILDEAQALFGEAEAVSALDYLRALGAEIGRRGFGHRIRFDLGLVHQIEYYTGVVFRGYVHGAAASVLNGGRYDNLLSFFGTDAPATGFAIDVNAVAESRKAGGESADRRLKIAITKGRLLSNSIAMFEKMGLDCETVKDPGRKLVAEIGNRELDVVMSKAPDVITYVEHGVCDMGIVGKDTILENGTSFYEVLDLGFGKCRFALAVREGEDFYKADRTRRVASKYPNVAKRYFADKGMDVSVIKIEGSVELAPILGLADAIVDIVETGSTLKANGLVPIETIHDVSARLIINTASMKLHKRQILEFIESCEDVIHAAD